MLRNASSNDSAAAAVAAALCSEPSLAREMADSLIPALLHILREACDEISGAVGGGAASVPPADRAEPASEQSVRLVLDVLDALLGIALRPPETIPFAFCSLS